MNASAATTEIRNRIGISNQELRTMCDEFAVLVAKLIDQVSSIKNENEELRDRVDAFRLSLELSGNGIDKTETEDYPFIEDESRLCAAEDKADAERKGE